MNYFRRRIEGLIWEVIVEVIAVNDDDENEQRTFGLK